MKGRQLALMPGNEDKVGYWLTPPDLMKKLDEEFHFDFDACPYPRPAGFDGLKEEWGTSTWVNPPFREANWLAWARKAVAENQAGKTVVFIAPTTLATYELMNAGAEVRALREVAWQKPTGRAMPHGRPQLLFILRPHSHTDNRM
jgi:hypothetical protein